LNRKMVPTIVFTLLLASTLTLGFNTKLVRASGTVYIRADGSIDPPTAPISTVDNVTYTFAGDINDSIVIERDNVVVDGAGYTVEGPRRTIVNGITLSGRTNVTIKDMTIGAFNYGIYLDSSSNNSISGNNVTNNYSGIVLEDSSVHNSISGNNITTNNEGGIHLDSFSGYNSISGNNITTNNHYGILLAHSSSNSISTDSITANTGDGIWFDSSSGNSISGNNITTNKGYGIVLGSSSRNRVSGNNITSNWRGILLYSSSSNNSISANNITAHNENGIYLDYSSNNSIFHNNFINNAQQVYSTGLVNVWDNGYPSGGNYWSNYNGTNLYSGPYQNETGSDGIGDTPYAIDADNRDNYPLMQPYVTVLGDLNDSVIATAPVRVYIGPPTIVDPSTFFNVSVKIENVQELAGIDLILSWNPFLLYGVNMTEVIFHETVPQSEWDNIWRLRHVIDNGKGEAEYVYLYADTNRAIQLGYAPISGNFTIFVITFQVRSLGNCTLHFDISQLADSEPYSILHDTTDGFFSNSIPPPSIPPSPSGDAEVSLYVDPHGVKNESLAIGSTFSITVKLDSIANHEGIAYAGFDLDWNWTLLECINVTEVMFHEVIPQTDWDNISMEGWVAPSLVHVIWRFKNIETLEKYGPIFGNHTLAIVTFRVINVGKCPLYLHDCQVLENSSTNVWNFMLYTARSGYFSNAMSGDLNGDGAVNLLDALVFAKSFGSHTDFQSWNEDADINGDGFIDIYDTILLCNHFGHTG
jgi:parallel beta-helix repeat protein